MSVIRRSTDDSAEGVPRRRSSPRRCGGPDRPAAGTDRRAPPRSAMLSARTMPWLCEA